MENDISANLTSTGVYIKNDAGYWSNQFEKDANNFLTMTLSTDKKDKFLINTISGLELYIISLSAGKYLQWSHTGSGYSITNSPVDSKITWDKIPSSQDRLPLSFYGTFIRGAEGLSNFRLQAGASTGFNFKRVNYQNKDYVEAVGYEKSVFSLFSQTPT